MSPPAGCMWIRATSRERLSYNGFQTLVLKLVDALSLSSNDIAFILI
jgi:hypothetical protein